MAHCEVPFSVLYIQVRLYLKGMKKNVSNKSLDYYRLVILVSKIIYKKVIKCGQDTATACSYYHDYIRLGSNQCYWQHISPTTHLHIHKYKNKMYIFSKFILNIFTHIDFSLCQKTTNPMPPVL